MKLKEFFVGLAKALGKGVKNIFKAICDASLTNLIKFGVVAGVATATVVAIYKFVKMKIKSYHDESEKTVVDRTLQINQDDLRNQEELHPLMKKVRKNLMKGEKRSMTEKAAKKFKKNEKARKKKKQERAEYFQDVMSAYFNAVNPDSSYSVLDDDDIDADDIDMEKIFDIDHLSNAELDALIEIQRKHNRELMDDVDDLTVDPDDENWDIHKDLAELKEYTTKRRELDRAAHEKGINSPFRLRAIFDGIL